MSEETTPNNLQTPKHSVEGVGFNTDTKSDTDKAVRAYNETTTPKIIKWTMRSFCVNQKQAEWVLFGFVIVMVLISLQLVFGVAHHKTPKYSLPPGQHVAK